MTELAQRQVARRKNLEAEIRRCGATMAANLRAIHNEKLYLSTHESWEDYCSAVWGMSKSYACRLLEHGRVLDLLADSQTLPMGDTQTAKTSGKSKKTKTKVAPEIAERATREVAGLPDETKVEVLTEAVATAPDGKPTAKHVAETRKKITGGTAFNVEEFEPGPAPEFEPVEPVEASIVKDAIDRDVPTHLREKHEAAAAINSEANKLDAIRRKVAELAGLPGGEFIQISEIEQEFKRLKGKIAQSRYWTECPKCRGNVKDNCDKCAGAGYLPFTRRGTLSAGEKEWLGIA